MNNRTGLYPKAIWASMMDYDLWPMYLLGLLCFVPIDTPSTYLTLTLRSIGFSTFNTNLLTIPSTVAGCFTLLGLTYFSTWVNERAFIASWQAIWVLPCLIALRVWPGALVDAWGTFGLMTVLLSYPYCHAIRKSCRYSDFKDEFANTYLVVGWTSTNSGSVRTRTVSASVYNISVQLGDIIGANVYISSDAPLYHHGNTILIAIDVAVLFIFLFTKLYYVLKNRSRAKRWDAMSEIQKAEYLSTTKDSGNKRLDFRFIH